MPEWWDSLADKKQYPWVPLEPAEESPMFALSFFAAFAGFVLLLGGIVGALFGANWAGLTIGAACVCILIAQVTLPADKRRK